MADILLIRPEDDSTSRRMSEYAKTFRNQLPPHHALGELTGKKHARRQRVDSALPVDVLYFLGHGTDSDLRGIGQEILVDASNVGRATIVLALGCQSATQLGPEAIRRRVRAHVGWTRWWIAFFPGRVPDPTDDAVARCLLSIVGGQTADCATMAIRPSAILWPASDR